jgi:uncharacterized iron-regulated membrane protein
VRKATVIANKLHKWLGLLVGIQVLVWLLSGLYMVMVDIDFIHGDPLVRNTQQTLAPNFKPSINLAQLRTEFPQATAIGLKPLLGRGFFTVNNAEARYLIDASSGQVMSPLDEKMAMEIAEYHYRGDAPLMRARLITSDAPTEIGARVLPLWRLDFDDSYATSFYIDPYDGALVTRRHRYWRIFDFLWMLHIMDYDDRNDIHHPLLWSAQVTGLLLAVSGSWLLIHRMVRRKKRRRHGIS